MSELKQSVAAKLVTNILTELETEMALLRSEYYQQRTVTGGPLPLHHWYEEAKANLLKRYEGGE